MAKRTAKRTAPTSAKGKQQKRHTAGARAHAPAVVQLRFHSSEGNMAKRAKTEKKKTNPKRSSRRASAAKPSRRPRRRNPRTTFVQALGRVAGAAAAMFGTGVAVTYATSKVPLVKDSAGQMQPNKLALYGIPLAAALAGAAIATKAPMVGAGVAAGAAAPFVLPVAARMMAPPGASTVSALRAVAMGGTWRELNQYPRPACVGAVSLGAVYAD